MMGAAGGPRSGGGGGNTTVIVQDRGDRGGGGGDFASGMMLGGAMGLMAGKVNKALFFPVSNDFLISYKTSRVRDISPH